MRYLIILSLVLLAGCGATTKGKETIVNNDFYIRDCGNVTISPDLATRSGDMAQEVSAPTENNLDFVIDWLESMGMTKAANKLKSVITEQPAADEETTTTIITPVIIPDNDDTEEVAAVELLSYPFDHTQFEGSDGGISLVLCKGDSTKDFDCKQGDVKVPYHGLDDERVTYWNMTTSGTGNIICTKDDKSYEFKTVKGKLSNGKCN